MGHHTHAHNALALEGLDTLCGKITSQRQDITVGHHTHDHNLYHALFHVFLHITMVILSVCYIVMTPTIT